MSEYEDLRQLGVVFRPISSWPGGVSEMHRDRQHSPFRAPFARTAEELGRELRMLGARRVVVEIALEERDFRTTDGLPRAQSRARHPGVVVSIADSDHGSMRYACDKFRTWQENLRGIAKGMEAQRLLARYGIAERGEQYAGWKQLAQTTMSTAEASAILRRHAAIDADEAMDPRAMYRRALQRAHPDHGGTTDALAEVQNAAKVLGLTT